MSSVTRDFIVQVARHPMMAMAGRVTIAEVEEIVPLGSLDPDDIHLPGVFVQRVIQGGPYENPIEYRMTR